MTRNFDRHRRRIFCDHLFSSQYFDSWIFQFGKWTNEKKKKTSRPASRETDERVARFSTSDHKLLCFFVLCFSFLISFRVTWCLIGIYPAIQLINWRKRKATRSSCIQTCVHLHGLSSSFIYRDFAFEPHVTAAFGGKVQSSASKQITGVATRWKNKLSFSRGLRCWASINFCHCSCLSYERSFWVWNFSISLIVFVV